MIISMQGNWTVSVKSKSAAFPQRFIISGATTGNGVYNGTVGTTATANGNQWSIAVQHNPGSGFQLSKMQLKYPKKVGSTYTFEIWSEDATDNDFNDLILTCTTSANINDFIIYGNASLYSGNCIFNPCLRFGYYVIDTYKGLLEALLNPKLKEILKRLYPERIPDILPDPPDPGPFVPLVIDLNNEATQPKTLQVYKRLEISNQKSNVKASAAENVAPLAESNFSLVRSSQTEAASFQISRAIDKIGIAKVIDGLYWGCRTEPASNITLTFEEYDRTGAELAGGAYTGSGNRRLLGDTITDAYGNYIFRFSFDMQFPGIEDSTDIAAGEDINVVAYPDVIVKVTGFAPYEVLYESAPYYNIPNLKRINLCLPKSKIRPTSACFNGNLIGSLGNVFIGGNQNSTASFLNSALTRNGYNNYLSYEGVISVGSSLAAFSPSTVECASWGGIIDLRGCLYDTSKSADANNIKWYTIRIMRQGAGRWEFVSQNYKHPKFSKRHLAGYTGDDVGSFSTMLHVDGGAAVSVPAYINIQREIFADGIDWEFSNFDRFMQLNTGLYDLVAGVVTPGTFYLRVDGYDAAGAPVANATDMIALFIHNKPLAFELSGMRLTDPAIISTSCGLYRLADGQMNTPMEISFKANDPFGFVDSYSLTMGRCPAPMLALQLNNHKPPLADTVSGAGTMAQGSASSNNHPLCPGYAGTLTDFSDAGLITINMQPAASEGGWIKADEYFTVLSFALTAYKRVTNGYNTGLSGQYYSGTSIYLERLNP